jgi:hypothetical protein
MLWQATTVGFNGEGASMGPYRREWALGLGVCAALAVLILGPNFLQWVGLGRPPGAVEAGGVLFETVLLAVVAGCIAIFAFHQYRRD